MLSWKAELEKEKNALNNSIDKIVHSDKSTEEQLKDTQELIELMDKLDGQERIKLRFKLRNQLRRLEFSPERKKQDVLYIFQRVKEDPYLLKMKEFILGICSLKESTFRTFNTIYNVLLMECPFFLEKDLLEQ